MFPGVSQAGVVQPPTVQPQVQRGAGPAGAATSAETLAAGSQQTSVPEVQVEIRSESAVASASQVVPAADASEEGQQSQTSTQSDSQAANAAISAFSATSAQQPQERTPGEQAGGQTGEKAEQNSAGAPEGQVAQRYASQAESVNPKGGELDLVV